MFADTPSRVGFVIPVWDPPSAMHPEQALVTWCSPNFRQSSRWRRREQPLTARRASRCLPREPTVRRRNKLTAHVDSATSWLRIVGRRGLQGKRWDG
jgi:hypothetical protein